MGQMDPNLVGTAGLQPAGKEARDCVSRRRPDRFPAAPSGSSPPGHSTRPPSCREPAGGGRSVCRWCRSGARGHPRRTPGSPAATGPVRPWSANWRLSARVRTVGLRNHQQAGRVLVEPVHDAGPAHAADAREAIPAMGDQRVDERARPVARGRMDHHPLRLVDHDDRVVLEHDVERDGFGGRQRRLGRRNRDRDRVAGVDAMTGIADRAPADRDLAGEDERLEPRARRSAMARPASDQADRRRRRRRPVLACAGDP